MSAVPGRACDILVAWLIVFGPQNMGTTRKGAHCSTRKRKQLKRLLWSDPGSSKHYCDPTPAQVTPVQEPS